METQGVVYLVIGDRHFSRLTVSIYNLRKHYDGEIAILVPESEQEGPIKKIVEDKRIKAKLHPFPVLKKGTVYANKSLIPIFTPFTKTIFLDADTMPVGKIDDLWPQREDLIVVRMARWSTQGKIMGRRLSKWEKVAPQLVEEAKKNPVPAINTGVFSFKRYFDGYEAWSHLCRKNPIHICDEVALQLIYPELNHKLLDDRYNCCPVQGENKDKVIIWHFHNRHHVHPKGATIWIPAYTECLTENVGEITSWTPEKDEDLRDFIFRGNEPCEKVEV